MYVIVHRADKNQIKPSILILFSRFSVFDLHSEGYYIVNLKLEVCLDATKVPVCEAAIQPLKNFYLPKKVCQWDAPFSIQGLI